MKRRQDSLREQLADVVHLALDAGCYDAADWIMRAYGEETSPLRDPETMQIQAALSPSDGA